MKVIAVTFSARKDGNCSQLSHYCLEKFSEKGWGVELLQSCDLTITPCNHCDYECFSDVVCPINDDISMIYEKCRDANSIIFAVPNYGGHLAAVYFSFTERAQYEFKKFSDFEKEFLQKVNLIIIGNLSAGGDMVLHEALHAFANRTFWPETLLFSAREFQQSSLKGNLIESVEVRKRLDRFVEMVELKSRKT